MRSLLSSVMLVAESTQPTWGWLDWAAFGVLAAATVGATVGALWMMWVGLRHDRPVTNALVAAFVPFAFIRYYFKRANRNEREQFKRVLRISLSVVAIVMIIDFVFQRVMGI